MCTKGQGYTSSGNSRFLTISRPFLTLSPTAPATTLFLLPGEVFHYSGTVKFPLEWNS